MGQGKGHLTFPILVCNTPGHTACPFLQWKGRFIISHLLRALGIGQRVFRLGDVMLWRCSLYIIHCVIILDTRLVIDLTVGLMEMNRGSIHKDKFHSLICVPMPSDSVHNSQTMIQAIVTVMLLTARNSVMSIKTAEKFVSAVLGQITVFINVTLSRPQTKTLDNTEDYDLCTQYSP